MTWERIRVVGQHTKVYICKILVYKQGGIVNFYFHVCVDRLIGAETLFQGHI